LSARQDLLAATIFLILTGGLMLALQGTPDRAAALPRFVLYVLWWLSVALFVRSVLRIKREKEAPGQSVIADPKRLAISILALAVYAALLKPLGFYTASALFLLVLIPALGYRRPLTVSIVTAGLLGGFYLVFEVLFGRVLPPEFFEAALQIAGRQNV